MNQQVGDVVDEECLYLNCVGVDLNNPEICLGVDILCVVVYRDGLYDLKHTPVAILPAICGIDMVWA